MEMDQMCSNGGEGLQDSGKEGEALERIVSLELDLERQEGLEHRPVGTRMDGTGRIFQVEGTG